MYGQINCNNGTNNQNLITEEPWLSINPLPYLPLVNEKLPEPLLPMSNNSGIITDQEKIELINDKFNPIEKSKIKLF